MTSEEIRITKETLSEMMDEYIEGEGFERYPLPEWYAIDKALDALKELEEVQRWILVTERLPEDDEDVLAFDGGDYFVAWYGQTVVDAGWHSSDEYYDSYCPIIAWMPIEPYKEVDKDGK